jgi:hypothetical protein
MDTDVVQQLIDLADGRYYLPDDILSPSARESLREFVTPVVGHSGRVVWPVGELAAWF